jgi:hypothetical protein
MVVALRRLDHDRSRQTPLAEASAFGALSLVLSHPAEAEINQIGAPDEGEYSDHHSERRVKSVDIHDLMVGQVALIQVCDKSDFSQPFLTMLGWLYSVFLRDQGSLSPIVDMQLAQDAAHVGLHGLFA